MKQQEVIDIFKECNAILEGHFILTSGLHSPTFLQKARVFMYPKKTEILCKALAEKLMQADLGHIDYLVGPAVGGIIPVYETARHMDLPAIWVERENGEFRLRRFEMKPNARVVIIEDIVSSGLSLRETVASMHALGAEVVAAGCLIDRSGGTSETNCRLISLAHYLVPSYPESDLPPELAALPAYKPGSRHLNSGKSS